ncbi:hypothetical protein GY50_1050 [Dehalococcoides mccartyi GY50]|nr:hypothetical protein GY50_1050 [Dehalococcoides mccartyi GY50]
MIIFIDLLTEKEASFILDWGIRRGESDAQQIFYTLKKIGISAFSCLREA